MNKYDALSPEVLPRHLRLSMIWLVPAIAALIGLSLLIQLWAASGPEISITFQTASGLQAGKTEVKYKDVTIGLVKSIVLSPGSQHVLVTVSLMKNAEDLARTDTRFWVVRPRIGLGGVSGIDTLISGAYISLDTGASEKYGSTFKGLETPPTVINGMPGKQFEVLADDLGSLDIGSAVYYRRIPVGRVSSYALRPDGQGVSVNIFIDAPYDLFVTPASRFWNASGIDLSLNSEGLQLKTQTMASVITGGIAFANPPTINANQSAPSHSAFKLADDQTSAMAPLDGTPQILQLRFQQSLRGMQIGAPVEFSSVKLGKVTAIALDFEPSGSRFISLVTIEIYPNRLGSVLEKFPKPEKEGQKQAAGILRDLVQHGLRAQARAGNLLTGQLYISLDFVPNAAPAPFDLNARPLRIPTLNSGFEHLQEQVATLIGKVSKMPIESIGNNLNATLGNLNQTLIQVNGQVLPQTTQTLRQLDKTMGSAQNLLAADSPLLQTLTELQRTLYSLRTLTGLLTRQPQALLTGRNEHYKEQP
ncbi:PqiB family protein [Hafnia psychrotolerans]|uniref:Mammalian cell entry protein n=1 Tax=Hafnia psychrotolerans TaxID=1477018 RepID=A0ABQ1H451_9GAMM|nr:MlaD family protein [Hafnia psychrotolerans]GGA56235.1 mammalian cell entry protein [Hafnia psychrotolerans]